MKCFRKLAFLIMPLSLLLCLVLSGCHGRESVTAFAVPDGLDPSEEYEITFWAKNDTNKAQTNVYARAIEEFESIYPNIKVNIRLYTDYGKIYNDVITNIATDSTPNVCITYPDHIATYLTGENTVVPLDDLISDPKFGLGGSQVAFSSPSFKEMVPEYMEECRFKGFYYALPFMRSTEACYVNKTYIEKMGYTLPDILTWDFIWEVSEAAALKDPDGTYAVNGQSVMIPFIYKSTDNMMITMLKQLDAGYSDDSGNILIFNDTTAQILKEIAAHVKTGAFSTFKISGYPGNFFNAGQCIFAIDSTAGATWIGSQAPLSDISEDAFVQFETRVMMLPQYDPDNPQMISQGPSVCIFNKEDPREVLAAWLFAQYLITNDIQTAYAKTEGYVPVTLKARNSDEYQDYLARRGEDNSEHYSIKIDASTLLLSNTDHTFVTSVFNGSTSLRNAAGEMIEDVAKSTRRRKTVDDAYIQDLFKNVSSLYRLDQISDNSDDNPDDDSEGRDLGPLPSTAVLLLVILGAVWVCLGICALIMRFKKHND